MTTPQHKGARWYKCDLHLHTVASKCFQDKTVTAKQWVERAIQQGLDCVAVTDHNSNGFIDEIKSAAENTSLIVFPGVEITCDTSKIHLLILFDCDKTSQDVNDFLVRAGIIRDKFGEQDASTVKSVFEIAELAKSDGALVIPAHIDEFNGVNTLSPQNLERFYELDNINAVQVVHKDFLADGLQIQDNEELKSKINSYYNNPTPEIGYSQLKNYYTTVRLAKEKKLALLTFSDNPNSEGNSKHGLWGIGQQYTWIKMSDKPSLEGLRQAFLLPSFRIKNLHDGADKPNAYPELWIKSLTVEDTLITKENEPLVIDFNPQLNTIIGGRGSGKSSILRFLRGVLNNLDDLEALEEILDDQKEFYKIFGGKPARGVLKENSTITIEIVRNQIPHKIIANNFNIAGAQKITVLRLDENGNWQEVNDEGYLDFFDIEHYSQKQIYEIAQKPNALRERIDNSISEISILRNNREHLRNQYLEQCATVRTIEGQLQNKGKLETQIKDIDARIKIIKDSGIAEQSIIADRFLKEKGYLEEIYDDLETKEQTLVKAFEVFNNCTVADIQFDEKYEGEKNLIISDLLNKTQQIRESLIFQLNELRAIKENFVESIKQSNWKKDEEASIKSVQELKESLQNKGGDDILNYEKLNREKSELNIKLAEIKKNVASLQAEKDARDKFLQNYIEVNEAISNKRKQFLSQLVHSDKLKITLKSSRDKIDFEEKMRKILQRENDTFQSDIDTLSEICFGGNVLSKLKEIQEIFLKIRKNQEVTPNFTGKFLTLIKEMSDAQIDEIFLLIPEDEIEIQFKPNDQSSFKSLSTASAGQKTTAILTFILSYGSRPLILDQPEDDLDNRLVYGLVVDRLLEAKAKRQIIVVTHNANIPVNADADFIISMNSETKHLAINHSGTVELQEIKTEICDVMEGGNDAFAMRSKRYSL